MVLLRSPWWSSLYMPTLGVCREVLLDHMLQIGRGGSRCTYPRDVHLLRLWYS